MNINTNDKPATGDFAHLLRDPLQEERAEQSAKTIQPYTEEEIEVLSHQTPVNQE